MAKAKPVTASKAPRSRDATTSRTDRGVAAHAAPPRDPGHGKASRADKTALRRDAIWRRRSTSSAARGFAATRLDDVAQRAGVAKGTIYLHFADKEALFQELVTHAAVPCGRHAGAALAGRHSDPAVLERLDRGVRPRDFRQTRRKTSSASS